MAHIQLERYGITAKRSLCEAVDYITYNEAGMSTDILVVVPREV